MNKTRVKITSGQVEGIMNDGVYTYLGIPYAKAKRFMPPKRIKSWKDVFQANRYGNIAPQDNNWGGNEFLYNIERKQSEDCLNLNIWTPHISNKEKHPVMVWLHGGGFQSGSSMEQLVYDGTHLSKNGDVVVVSLNHRLNILGFLDLEEYDEKYRYSGNAGMMDIEAALQWIHENIEQFGGDKNNITLFGQSGGGAKILTLMAMPSVKDLFHKVIIESGAVETSGMTLTHKTASHRVAKLVLEKLGIDKNHIQDLETIDYQKLIKAGNEALEQVAKEQKISSVFGDGTYSLIWNPVVDGKYILADPIDTKVLAMSDNIPMIIGSNFSEWSTFQMITDIDYGKQNNKNNWSMEKTLKIIKQRYGDKSGEMIKHFQKAYPEKKLVDLLFVDALLRTRVLKTINLRSKQKAPIYTYLFAYETPLYGGFGMSYHCAELPYVFGNIECYKASMAGGKTAQNLSHQISQAWIQFARTGNPNHQGLSHWDKYTKENGATMIFDNNSEVQYHHDESLMKALLPNYEF